MKKQLPSSDLLTDEVKGELLAVLQRQTADGRRVFSQEEIEDFWVAQILAALRVYEFDLTPDITRMVDRFCLRAKIDPSLTGQSALEAAKAYFDAHPPRAELTFAIQSVLRQTMVGGEAEVARKKAAQSFLGLAAPVKQASTSKDQDGVALINFLVSANKDLQR